MNGVFKILPKRPFVRSPCCMGFSKNFAMAPRHHPTGVEVEVVGIEVGNRGRNCEYHEVCGSILEPDTVVRFRSVVIMNGM